eukprot:TRINITY_DN2320_c0_g1_i6.p1 TRINITY_DN2320_c0_g1~~TRINITY_DN2320_c0_g1_i6.p1  ORF type:complete len:214 (+),score=13.08 TRINITY_DN2320_c0_g1_i6:49-690(+)
MVSKLSILFNVPNLIGWCRVALSVSSFYFFGSDPWMFLVLYTLGFALDGLDGMAARYFNQSTLFGAIFDMVTDRASTAVLLIYTVQLGINIHLVAGLVALDFVSHFARMYMCGGHWQSHKDTSVANNLILRLYYGNTFIFRTSCIGQEGFYLAAYMSLTLQTPEHALIFHRIAVALALPFAFKQLANFAQMWDAFDCLLDMDIKKIEQRQKTA